jgi:GTP-binding protein
VLKTDDEAAALAAAAAAVRVAPTPASAALDRASSLFVRPEPEFLYSAPRFLNLPVNTRMPEICILGRSNVGKSTLLNALAGLESGGKAGNSYGSKTGRLGLAITSARAGCTKMMNGYGFGPPLRAAQTQTFERVEMEEERKNREGIPDETTMRGGVVSRSQKRAQKAGEPSPAHSLVLIDMPGYGFMSKSEWGTEITKYLERRATLRGAVLLVDAVAGLKDGDRQALAMLRDANIRTTIVLTKADKLLPPKLLRIPAAVAATKQAERSLAAVSATSTTTVSVSPEPAFYTGDSEGEQALRASCLRIWKTLRRTERASFGTVPWMEGQGWVPEIVVTGAGDPRGGGFGVAGARLAICRLAGLIPRHAAEGIPASSKKQMKAARKVSDGIDAGATVSRPVVPFDQIQWSETTTEAVIDQSAELAYISRQETARQERTARRRAAAVSAIEAKADKAESESAFVEKADSTADPSEVEPKATPVRGRRRPWKRA